MLVIPIPPYWPPPIPELNKFGSIRPLSRSSVNTVSFCWRFIYSQLATGEYSEPISFGVTEKLADFPCWPGSRELDFSAKALSSAFLSLSAKRESASDVPLIVSYSLKCFLMIRSFLISYDTHNALSRSHLMVTNIKLTFFVHIFDL